MAVMAKLDADEAEALRRALLATSAHPDDAVRSASCQLRELLHAFPGPVVVLVGGDARRSLAEVGRMLEARGGRA